MVTVSQVKKGLARYIDEEIVNRIAGLRKWFYGAVSAVAINMLDDFMEQYHSLLLSVGAVTEDGMVDIDKIASLMLETANEKGAVTEHLPLLGDVTFSSQDIEKLRKYIYS